MFTADASDQHVVFVPEFAECCRLYVHHVISVQNHNARGRDYSTEASLLLSGGLSRRMDTLGESTKVYVIGYSILTQATRQCCRYVAVTDGWPSAGEPCWRWRRRRATVRMRNDAISRTSSVVHIVWWSAAGPECSGAMPHATCCAQHGPARRLFRVIFMRGVRLADARCCGHSAIDPIIA